MRLREWIGRWRASRGYGVHSPLAFRIVGHVVRPPRDVVYYGEERLMASGAPGPDVSEARRLLRFVAELQPSTVWTSPGLPEIYKEAISLAGCVVRIFDGKAYPPGAANADMAVAVGRSLKSRDLPAVVRPGRSLFATGVSAGLTSRVRKAMKGGVMVEGRRSLMAVATADTDVHAYKVL